MTHSEEYNNFIHRWTDQRQISFSEVCHSYCHSCLVDSYSH